MSNETENKPQVTEVPPSPDKKAWSEMNFGQDLNSDVADALGEKLEELTLAYAESAKKAAEEYGIQINVRVIIEKAK